MFFFDEIAYARGLIGNVDGANCIDDNERNDMVNLIKGGSMMTWRHINLHGKYDFNRQTVNVNPFDMAKILSLQVA